MRTLLRLAKALLSIISFAGSLIRFAVYIAFALDIAVLFICGFGYFLAFLIPIGIVWAIPVVAAGLINKCDESIKESKENAYFEKMCRKNSYQGTHHESHYENYYDNMGYHYRDPDTFEITSRKTTTGSGKAASNTRGNAYYEKMGRKNSYQGNYHESHYENYYDNMGYRYRDPDTYEITSKTRNATDSKKAAANSRVNYAPRPDSCEPLYEEVHAAK